MKIISLSCPTYEALNRNIAKLIPNWYMGIKSIIFAIYSGMTEHTSILVSAFRNSADWISGKISLHLTKTIKCIKEVAM